MSPTFSEALGYTSIAMWLGAQFPQVLENMRLQSCEGLALPFLFNWFLGDFSNLIGCLLTNQLPFQLYLSMYFVFVDFMLLAQFVYYSLRNPRHPPSSSSHRHSLDRTVSRYRTLSAVAAVAAAAALSSQRPEHRRAVSAFDGSTSRVSEDEDTNALADSFHSDRPSRSTSQFIRGRSAQRPEDDRPEHHRRSSTRTSRRNGTMVFLAVFALVGYGSLPMSVEIPPSSHTGRVIGDELSALQIDKRIVGRIFAWLCTTLYLTSRLPQIWKNFTRKSVEGLSMSLFVFAFLGNTFYVASILTSPRMVEGTAFIRESIPYLLGSGGTLMFDVTIVSQHFLYRGRSPHMHHHHHHSSQHHTRHPTHPVLEEEEGLLSDGDLESTPKAETRGRPSTTSVV